MNGTRQLSLAFFDIIDFDQKPPEEKYNIMDQLLRFFERYGPRIDHPLPLSGESQTMTVPRTQVTIISDAVFLKELAGFEPDGFFEVVIDCKRQLADNGIEMYVIINQGVERPYRINESGTLGSDGMAFQVVTCVNECWPDIYNADIAIRNKNSAEWKGRYSIYSLIRGFIPEGYEIGATLPFSYGTRTAEVYALIEQTHS